MVLISVKQSAYLSPLAGRGRIATKTPSGVVVAIRVRGRRNKQRSYNGFQNTRHVLQNVIIPKSQNSIIMINQPCVTHDIARVVGVLPTVDLNNKSRLATDEIDRVGTDRLLPNELITVEASRPELVPQRIFSISGCPSKLSRARRVLFSGFTQFAMPPHPASSLRDDSRPLPASGERLRERRAARQAHLSRCAGRRSTPCQWWRIPSSQNLVL